MKTYSFAIILTAIAFAGCRKEYTCICTGGLGYQEYEKKVKAANTSNAKKNCESENPPPNSPDAIYCHLK